MLHIWIKVFSYIKAKDTNSEEYVAFLLPNAFMMVVSLYTSRVILNALVS